MKIQKFVPILLASALLTSCKIGTPDVSSSSPSNEQSASSALPSEESTAPVTSEETSVSSEETPVSSETSSSFEVTTPSSSEEPVTPPASSSSEEPTPAVISSWEQLQKVLELRSIPFSPNSIAMAKKARINQTIFFLPYQSLQALHGHTINPMVPNSVIRLALPL